MKLLVLLNYIPSIIDPDQGIPYLLAIFGWLVNSYIDGQSGRMRFFL